MTVANGILDASALSDLGAALVSDVDAAAAIAAKVEAQAAAVVASQNVQRVYTLRSDLTGATLDEAGVTLAERRTDGSQDLTLAEIRDAQGNVLGGEHSLRALGFLVRDSAGQTVASLKGHVDGDVLTPRLAKALTEVGLPADPIALRHNMIGLNLALSKLAMAAGGQVDFAVIGTSWSSQSGVGIWRDFAAKMIAKLGDAGLGYTGFSWPSGSTNAFPNSNMRGTPLVYSNAGGGGGSWATQYLLTNAPDLGGITSSTAGDRIQVNSNVASPVLTLAKLFFTGTADGVIKYRWNGGAWSGDTNVQGTVGQLQTLSLASLPAGTTWTLDVEVVSGAVHINGCNFENAGAGIRFHNLACSTSHTGHYAAADATNWRAGIAALGLDHLVIAHTTNDRGASRTPADYAANQGVILDRFLAEYPNADASILMEWDVNFSGAPYSTAEYRAAAQAFAYERGCGFVDLQYAVGPDTSKYFAGVGRNLMADAYHPNTDGKAAITPILFRAYAPPQTNWN